MLISYFKGLDGKKPSQHFVAHMSEEKDRYLSLRVLKDDQVRLDELRRAEDGEIPSRGEMIRRLIGRAYEKLMGKPSE